MIIAKRHSGPSSETDLYTVYSIAILMKHRKKIGKEAVHNLISSYCR